MPDPTTVKTDAQGEATADSKPKTTWVVSTRADERVVVWDPSDVHPGGEAWVAGKVPAEVAMTPDISGKLRMGELREATEAEIAKRKAQLATLEAPAAKGVWE
jgi:hypothetical protein